MGPGEVRAVDTGGIEQVWVRPLETTGMIGLPPDRELAGSPWGSVLIKRCIGVRRCLWGLR